MAKINILDKTIFSKIAAGEVVDRPSSVIKEMVENSIDAKSSQITIEVKQGGTDLIKVSDNGTGIEKDDFHSAFLPHATSKICQVEDLEKIATLGFRGEALSSIAAVSKVTLTSKTESSPLGYTMSIADGDIAYEHEIGCAQGTTISAEDLFYSVPARKKFLKKPKLEEAECTNIVSRLILANPFVSIKYIADDKVVYHSSGKGLLDAIFCIYGKNFVDQMVEVCYDDGQVKMNGYISKPHFVKANRTYQTLIINGRYVQNSQISAAVYKAYEGFLMKGGFPIFVLNMSMPLDKIDVNVHPNKLEVKFDDSSRIFSIILRTVSEKLYAMSHVQKVEENNKELEETFSKIESYSTVSPIKAEDLVTSYKDTNLKEVSLDDEFSIIGNYTTSEIAKQLKTNTDKQTDLSRYNEIDYYFQNTGSTLKSDNGQFSSLLKHYNTEVEKQSSRVQNDVQEEILDLNIKDYKQVGIVFNTYILIEKGNNMLVIDQHAGHERILYDQFKKQYMESEVVIQDLLVPYVVDLNAIEFAFLCEHKSVFEKLGIFFQPFGDHAIKIESVPVVLKDIDFAKYMETILKDTQNISIKKSDMLEDYLARTACRSAVKANDILSSDEVDKLIAMLGKSDQVLLCPHGRPIVVEISKKEMEKWFKRIV